MTEREITAQRHAALVRSLFRIQGADPLRGMVDQAQPVLEVNPSPNGAPDLAFLLQWSLAWGSGGGVTAGAGIRAKEGLFNPLDSNEVVVIELFQGVVASGLAQVRTMLSTVAPPNWVKTNLAYPRDSRIGGKRTFDPPTNFATRADIWIQNSAALAAGEDVVWRSTTTEVTLTRPVVLGPGAGIMLTPNADNVLTVHLNVVWRSRQFLPGERPTLP